MPEPDEQTWWSEWARSEPTPTRARTREVYSQEFERVWKAYPRGEQKRKAFASFKRHVAAGDLERVLVAVGHLVAAREPRFCPYAERFFPDWQAWEAGDPSKVKAAPPSRDDAAPLVPDTITDEWERMRYLSRRSNGGGHG